MPNITITMREPRRSEDGLSIMDKGSSQSVSQEFGGYLVQIGAAVDTNNALAGAPDQLTRTEVVTVRGVVSGAVISGTWRGIPAAGPVMRVRMTGSGTVSMDSATGDLGAGTVTTAAYTNSVSGTQIDDYAYPGDAARSIRFTLTGTAAVEVY